MSRRALIVAVAAGAIGQAAAAWYLLRPAEERVIRGRLDSLVDDFNDPGEGLASLAKAVALASYFTEDVRVDLGPGSPPIEGREALVGAASALQPRTAALRAGVDDVGIAIDDGGTSASVTLTATVTRRNLATLEETLDAREFALTMTKRDGTWRIAHAKAVDTLR